MVCYFVECENIDELKSMLNFGTAGLPYVAEWVPQNLEFVFNNNNKRK